MQRDDHYARSVGARRHVQLSAHATVVHVVGDFFAHPCQFAELSFGKRIVGLCSQFPILCGLVSQVIRMLVHVTTSPSGPSPHLKPPIYLQIGTSLAWRRYSPRSAAPTSLVSSFIARPAVACRACGSQKLLGFCAMIAEAEKTNGRTTVRPLGDVKIAMRSLHFTHRGCV